MFGSHVINTLPSSGIYASPEKTLESMLLMLGPFAPCFAGSVAGAQVYLRARSVIHNGYSASWNVKVNHLSKE